MAIGLSDFNSILVGAGGGYRLANTLVFAEASGDVLIGHNAPPFGQSPLRADLGARQFLSPALSLEALCEVELSSRTGDRTFGPAHPHRAPLHDAPRPALPFRGRCVSRADRRFDASTSRSESRRPRPLPRGDRCRGLRHRQFGAPLKEAKVEIVIDDKTFELEPDDTGKYRASRVPLGKGKLSIRAEGRKPIDQPIELKSRTPLSVEIRSEAVLPSGQVRGLVRSYDGKAIAAKISVEPKGLQVNTDAQGFFQIDVPPGAYQVVIEAKGYRAQRRSVTVEKDGVLI